MKKHKKNDKDKWQERALKETKKVSFDDLVWDTEEGIKIKPLYTSDDLKQTDHLETFPGSLPFVRGPRSSMYVGKPWTIRQYAGFSTAEESNLFYKKNLSSGQQGLSVAFDLATHRGYDSDHYRVKGDVGKAGVAIDSVEDMKILFDGIPLDKTSISMTMNGAVLPIMANFIVAAEEADVPLYELSGTLQNDILKEFMVRNTYIYPPKQSMRIVADIIEYSSKYMPKFNPVSISGYHMQEAGANAVQELAFTIADGLEYIQLAVDRGLKVDDFAPRLSFFFGIGMNFFMEIAKLRAARILWATYVKRRFKPKDDKSLALRTHCQTSGVSLTNQDPYNNIIRTTIEALSAVLGGTQSLHTNSFDEALGLPTEESATIARNTQLILQEETGLTNIIDPLAGSYYVESLTQELFDKASSVIDEIYDFGGMTQFVESGLPKLQIEESAIRRQASIDRKETIVVGVNKYTTDGQPEIDILDIDNESVRTSQIEKLEKVKQKRDQKKCKAALEKLQNAASSDSKNLLELAIDAARSRATVGEISSALEQSWGRFEASTSTNIGVFGSIYKKESRFLDITNQVESFLSENGRRPRILVCKLGQDGHDRGAKVISSAFADFGFDVDIAPMFQAPKEVVKQAIENDVHVIGISTQAAGHKTLIPDLMRCLNDLNVTNMIVVCGGNIPQKDHAHLHKAGVAAIFGPQNSIHDVASRVLTLIHRV